MRWEGVGDVGLTHKAATTLTSLHEFFVLFHEEGRCWKLTAPSHGLAPLLGFMWALCLVLRCGHTQFGYPGKRCPIRLGHLFQPERVSPRLKPFNGFPCHFPLPRRLSLR
ncbi:hypothetical protein SLE2022_093040 [Rubroshorea leprosula]